MNAWVPLLLALGLVAVATPALAGPAEVCTSHIKIIDPMPVKTCAGLDYEAVNDFCAYALNFEKCVQFVGPVIW